MDSEDRLDPLVAPLRDDVLSGASTLGRTASDVLRRAVIRLPARSLDELRAATGEVARQVLEAQPAMAPLVALVCDVLTAIDGATSLETGRHAAATAADAFRNGFERRVRDVVEAARDLLSPGGTIATSILSAASLLAP